MAGTYAPEMSAGGIRPLRMMGDSDVKIVFGRFTFDSSYVTAGESLPASSLGVDEILALIPAPAYSTTVGVNGRYHIIDSTYDYTNSKLIAIGGSAAAASGGTMNIEVPNATDLSAFTVRFIAVCR